MLYHLNNRKKNEKTMKNSKHLIIAISALFMCIAPEQAWALQPHGEPEGLYVHQMSHILFMAALTYLYLHTRRTTTLVSKGWRYLRIFCLLLFLWNLLAFTGHYVDLYLLPSDFVDKGTWNAKLIPPITAIKIFFFFSRMDHFFNVSALLALMISLRTFYLEARKEVEK